MKLRTVLVTGATKGIGLATSNRLSENGYEVIGIARNVTNDFPGRLYLCDISNFDNLQDVLEIITKNHQIDILFNNYGVNKPDSLLNLNTTDFDNVIKNNLLVTTKITQFLCKQMIQSKWGRVINNASVFINGRVNRTAYASSKAALVSATKTWALELAQYNICVNAIAPGPTNTELFNRGFPINSSERNDLIKSIPMGKLAEPDQIASMVEYLASEPAGYITGQVFYIDGGLSVGGLQLV